MNIQDVLEDRVVASNIDMPVDEVVRQFGRMAIKHLGIPRPPKLRLISSKDAEDSFGHYDPPTDTITLVVGDRHIMDILRTLAHELTHCKQFQDRDVPLEAGETGSKWENEANSEAGIIMRNFQNKFPEFFKSRVVAEARSAQKQSMIAYHGTDSKFASFNPNTGTYWFTPDKDAAASQGRYIVTAKITFTNPYYWKARDPEPDAPEFRNKLISAGYDSIIAPSNIAFDDDIILFSSTQIQMQSFVLAEASGYIPTKKQAKDPRFSTALTVDIRPGQLGKEANKLDLKTDSQGAPALLQPNAGNIMKTTRSKFSAEECAIMEGGHELPGPQMSFLRELKDSNEPKLYTAKQVLDYVNKIHHEFKDSQYILSFPKWELTAVPLSKLMFDNDVDVNYANTITKQDINKKPIVVDPSGAIIDGNHRTFAARSLGLDKIQAFVPINEE